MSNESNNETGLLKSPQSQPMQERRPRPNTTILSEGARLQVRMGDEIVVLQVQDYMLIGRTIEGDDPASYALDLGPFGGYQNGVSRQHAAITRHEGGLYIEDLGSTNGTRINGFQLTARRKYRLRDGDEIEFARLRTVFRFVHPGDE
ncbi:MAG: hypothetical protein OHK0046_37380 [Anaerolineae bacterium]